MALHKRMVMWWDSCFTEHPCSKRSSWWSISSIRNICLTLLATPSAFINRVHEWAASSTRAFFTCLIILPLHSGCHVAFVWMLASAIGMAILSDPKVEYIFYKDIEPPTLYYWEVVSHGGTIFVAFSFLYAYMWRRPNVAFIAFYWLLTNATFQAVITLAQWHTGTIPVLHLLHALLAASYFYMAGLVVSWIQLQHLIETLWACGSGELDDFDEQSLYQLGDFSWKEFESEEKMPSSMPGEDLGWGRMVGNVWRQSQDAKEARVTAWNNGVGRGEVDLLGLAYSIEWSLPVARRGPSSSPDSWAWPSNTCDRTI